MAILDVPENIAMVKASREQIEQARLQSQRARLQAIPTAQQLRFGAASGLAGLQKRQAVESSIRKYETGVAKSETEFETQVAKYEPEQAKPEYLDKVYKEAVKEAKPQMDTLRERIATAEQTIKRLTEKQGLTKENKSTVQNLQDSINQDQQELAVYEGKLGNKVEFVKGWYTGGLTYEAAARGSSLAKRYQIAEIQRGDLVMPTKPEPILKERVVANVTTKAQVQQGIGRDYGRVPEPSKISKIFSKPGEILSNLNVKTSRKLKEIGVTKEGVKKILFGTGGIQEQQAIESLAKRRGVSIEEAKKIRAEGGDAVFGLTGTTKAVRSFISGAEEGVATTIVEKPVTATTVTAAFAAAPSIISRVASRPLISSILTKEVLTGTTYATTTEKLIGGGLAAGYAYSVKSRIESKPTAYEKGLTTGEILSTEVVPMVAGGYIAAKVVPKISDIVRTRGMIEVPRESITQQAVISGKTRFAYLPKEQRIAAAYSQKYRLPDVPPELKKYAFGYSATSKPWTTTKIGETGQFYSVAGVSEPFFRISPKTTYYGGSLTSPFGSKPTLYAGYAKRIVINPAKTEIVVPSAYSPKGAKKYIFSKPYEEGVFQLPQYKPEAEAVIFGETVPFRAKYYEVVSGRRVPIIEQTFKEQGKIKVGGKDLKLLERVSKGSPSSTYIPESYPLTTPASYLVGLGLKKSSISKIEKPSSVIYVDKGISKIKISDISTKEKPKISRMEYPKKVSPPSITPRISKPSLPTPPSVPEWVEPPRKPSEPVKPKPKVPLIPPLRYLYPSVQKQVSRKISLSSAYEVQVKRYGEYKTIGKGLTLGRAKLLGVKTTTGTLGQTFRLVPKGETASADIGFEVPTSVYTRLKKPTSPLEWVERRGKTLKRGTGEIPEITSARRKKAKKIKWL